MQSRILLYLICAASFSVYAALKPMEARFNEIQEFAEQLGSSKIADNDKADAIGQRYQALFSHEIGSDQLPLLTDEQLFLLYRATQETAFISKHPKHAHDLQKIVNVLDSRNLAQARHFNQVFDSFIRARMFSEAEQLLTHHPIPAQEPLPEFVVLPGVSDGVPSEWVFSESARLVERRPVNLNLDWQIIVVSHPQCHFSSAAMTAITGDAKLQQQLAGRIKWVSPQDSNFSFSEFQGWNRHHPQAQMTAVHRAAEWPLGNFSATPIFYFLRNGKVVEELGGWPAEGNKKAFTEALGRLNPPR